MSMVAVATMSDSDKVKEMIIRSKKYFYGSIKDQIDALVSPENVVIVCSTFLLWAISHLFGVGEVIDVALLLIGAAALGPSVGEAITTLIDASMICLQATNDSDLDRSAELFAKGATTLGFDALMALLLRRTAKGIEVSRGGGVVRPSWLKVATPRQPGLPNVGPDPNAGQLWSRFPPLKAVGPGQLPPRVMGGTDVWGSILYLMRGDLAAEEATVNHELVHRALTPRFFFLRTFRVQLKLAGYGRLVLLKYVEEAMCQGYSELLKNPLTGLFKGIAFPIANGYMTISDVAAEGMAIGTLILGGQRFVIAFDIATPWWVKDIPIVYVKTGVENIYGWWWFNMDGGIWCYYFARNKTVRWYDIFNHRNGQGKWAAKADFVEVVWNTGTRETWPFEILPTNQKGTSTKASGKASEFTAIRVWDDYISKIAGRWRMDCDDRWIWNIDFTPDGNVKWSDYYNPSENGQGTWHLTRDGVYVMWASGSRDNWIFSAAGNEASGKAMVAGKPYPFEAAKAL